MITLLAQQTPFLVSEDGASPGIGGVVVVALITFVLLVAAGLLIRRISYFLRVRRTGATAHPRSPAGDLSAAREPSRR